MRQYNLIKEVSASFCEFSPQDIFESLNKIIHQTPILRKESFAMCVCLPVGDS